MARFVNRLTWSYSRNRLFRDCRKAYYFQYYASWGGWEKDANDFSKRAYLLKNIRTIDIWIGDIVHQVIKWLIEEIKASRDQSLDTALFHAKRTVKRTWEQSRSKSWEQNVKHNLNLLEHYYNCEPSKDELTEKLRKITKSLNFFYNSGFYDYLKGIKPEEIIAIDSLDKFTFEGVNVFAVPDLAVKREKILLYDWKTGKSSQNDAMQLSCYVLYGCSKWGADVDNFEITPVYLAKDDLEYSSVGVIPIEEVKTYIRDSLSDMRSLLISVEKNEIDPNKCEKTIDKYKCPRCKFKQICDQSQ
mgnify:FL=1|tara:strand:+ start:523 stop:1428 length:906 start_codon:yes stop_codon:yes gene_type:complete